MNKKILIFLAAFLIVILVIYRYGFFIVMWLFTPRMNYPKGQEKLFIDSLQKVCDCREVSRSPRYFMDDIDKKDTYMLFLTDFNCNKNVDSMKRWAFDVCKRAYLIMNKSPKFTDYKVVFECIHIPSISYHFKPKELEKGIANDKD